MKTFTFVAIVAGLLLGTVAYTDGPFHYYPRYRVDRKVGRFHGINISGNVTAEIEKADEPSLTLEGDKDSVSRVFTGTDKGQLYVTAPGRFPAPGTAHGLPVRVIIRGPELDSLDVSNAARATVSGFAGPEVKIYMADVAHLTFEGRYASYELLAMGASTANLSKLEARAASIKVDSASTASIAALELLRGTVSGASRVTYYGEPNTSEVFIDDSSQFIFRREQ
jgi:hypothetical protein